MLVVKTYLKEFPGKGIGLVSKNFILKGSVVWKYNPIVDITIKKKNVPLEAKEFYETYPLDYDEDGLVLNTDNARFINHSKNPNIKSLGKRKDNLAIKDIKPGEEITIDYEKIDKKGINFKDAERYD